MKLSSAVVASRAFAPQENCPFCRIFVRMADLLAATGGELPPTVASRAPLIPKG
jgi:hypothetical protein